MNVLEKEKEKLRPEARSSKKRLHETHKSSDHKKSKKHKKEKKQKKYKIEKNEKLTDNVLRNKHRKRRSSNSSETSEEWVEKIVESTTKPKARDDWMTCSISIPTYFKEKKREKKPNQSVNTYDPSKSARELNPYWVDGGKGIPKFKKPTSDDENELPQRNKHRSKCNWRKSEQQKSPNFSYKYEIQDNTIKNKQSFIDKPQNESRLETNSTNTEYNTNILTDQEINELGSKMIKAEIMGNNELANELKNKLEKAKNNRKETKNIKTVINSKVDKQNDEHIVLTTTDKYGTTRPLQNRKYLTSNPNEMKNSKKNRVETHSLGERIMHYADDDRYDIKQMFEQEKYSTADDYNSQLINIAGKHRNPKDDLDDIFADNIRTNISVEDLEKKDKEKAIGEYKQFTKCIELCGKCLDSRSMEKKLIICMGKNVYLSLPSYEGLKTGHCLIVPIQHISCSTQLDEDTWEEINDFRKALTNMFTSRAQDVIFFETARYINKRPHMAINCIPSSSFEMAPFYFKKAIQESEQMWATNKQLIYLKDKDIRKSIPRGLPYFWVNFGMDSGFAHVIEDQEKFSSNFAEEIIGGILQLDKIKWRKPKREKNAELKVKQFIECWKAFDCTTAI